MLNECVWPDINTSLYNFLPLFAIEDVQEKCVKKYPMKGENILGA